MHEFDKLRTELELVSSPLERLDYLLTYRATHIVECQSPFDYSIDRRRLDAQLAKLSYLLASSLNLNVSRLPSFEDTYEGNEEIVAWYKAINRVCNDAVICHLQNEIELSPDEMISIVDGDTVFKPKLSQPKLLLIRPESSKEV